MLKIRNLKTGETTSLSRDVRDVHPEWVHEQLGTESESELQGFLDNCSMEEFLLCLDTPDDCGVFYPINDAPSKYIAINFLRLPVEALPNAAFVDPDNAWETDAWSTLRHVAAAAFETCEEKSGSKIRVQADRPGWKDGRIID